MSATTYRNCAGRSSRRDGRRCSEPWVSGMRPSRYFCVRSFAPEVTAAGFPAPGPNTLCRYSRTVNGVRQLDPGWMVHSAENSRERRCLSRVGESVSQIFPSRRVGQPKGDAVTFCRAPPWAASDVPRPRWPVPAGVCAAQGLAGSDWVDADRTWCAARGEGTGAARRRPDPA